MQPGTAQQVNGSAIRKIGLGYSEIFDGGVGPNYYDCSGFCMVSCAENGIYIARNTQGEFRDPSIKHIGTPQFMCLAWYQVPSDAGSVPGIPDHVGFWINETTLLAASRPGVPIGYVYNPPNSREAGIWLLGYGLPPYADSTPPIITPPKPTLPPSVVEAIKEPTLFTTDPTSGKIIATDASGNLYVDEGGIPGLSVVTLGQHPQWGAGNELAPCVGIAMEKDPDGTWGYTFFTAPLNGKGSYGPYNRYHANRNGTFTALDVPGFRTPARG